MTVRTAIASTVHHPLGKPGGPGLFRIKGEELPAYIQNVAKHMTGPKSRKIRLAIGIVRNWAEGHDGHGHRVSPEVQAAAQKAIAEYDASRAKARAIPNKSNRRDMSRGGGTMRYDAWGNPISEEVDLSRVDLAVLTAKKRKRLKRSQFAVPKGKGSNPSQNSYPIPDEAHARNALARVSQFGTPEEQRMVKAAVKRKFPNIGQGK